MDTINFTYQASSRHGHPSTKDSSVTFKGHVSSDVHTRAQERNASAHICNERGTSIKGYEDSVGGDGGGVSTPSAALVTPELTGKNTIQVTDERLV